MTLTLDMSGADLSLLNSGRAPLLMDHERRVEGLVGVVRRAWIEGDGAYAEVRFAQHGVGELAYGLVRDRILSNVSVGMQMIYRKPLPGEPDALIGYWRPYEVSLCTVPADWTARTLNGAPSYILHGPTVRQQ